MAKHASCLHIRHFAGQGQSCWIAFSCVSRNELNDPFNFRKMLYLLFSNIDECGVKKEDGVLPCLWNFLFFFYFLLNLLGWHELIQLCLFQGYNSVIHHLYIVLCVHNPSQISLYHHSSPLYLLLPSPKSKKNYANLSPGLDHDTESLLPTISGKEAESQQSLPELRYPDIHHSASLLTYSQWEEW